jgi:hypothetical protein
MRIEPAFFTRVESIAVAKRILQNGLDTMQFMDELFLPILTDVTGATLHAALDAALQYRVYLNDFLTLQTSLPYVSSLFGG